MLLTPLLTHAETVARLDQASTVVHEIREALRADHDTTRGTRRLIAGWIKEMGHPVVHTLDMIALRLALEEPDPRPLTSVIQRAITLLRSPVSAYDLAAAVERLRGGSGAAAA